MRLPHAINFGLYVSQATELCQLAQTHRTFSNATVADVLWGQLILEGTTTLA